MITFVHPVYGLPVVVEPDEGGWLVAYVPGLPGCVAQGRSMDEVVANALGAIGDVLEVIREDDPERYAALTATTRTEPIRERDTTNISVHAWQQPAAA